MLEYPSLKKGKKKVKSYVSGFRGINRTNDYRDGDLENCSNIDADALPYVRAGRGYVSENIPADDLIYADGIARVITQDDGQNYLYYRPEKEGSGWFSYPVVLTAGKKEVAAVGGKVFVMPDKKILDLTEKYPTWRSIEKEVFYADSSARLYGNSIVFKNDTDFQSFTSAFKVGDAISCTGGYYYINQVAKSWVDKKMIVREISNRSEKKVTFDPYTFYDANADSITEFTFKKTVPDITHLCSWNDRVWGCSSDGKIWASKYNDPTNFEYFDLTSADSFTLEAGTGGAFTGSCATGSYIAFFRQNKIHRITGTKPSNYRHTVIKQPGVMNGSERSLAVISDIIYYEGKEGVYAFDGADARLISEKLGDFVHSEGIGAARGEDYYICMKNEGGNFDSYIYYPRKGIWLRDGLRKYQSAVSFLGNMYFINKDEKVIYKVADKQGNGNFQICLRAFEADFAEKKGFMRICIGYTKRKSGSIICFAAINGDTFEEVGRFTEGTEGVAEIRLTPNRGDIIKLNILGSYNTTIKYVMREYHTHGTVV